MSSTLRSLEDLRTNYSTNFYDIFLYCPEFSISIINILMFVLYINEEKKFKYALHDSTLKYTQVINKDKIHVRS